MTRGYLYHHNFETGDLWLRLLCGWFFLGIGFYGLDFGLMVALRWSGRVNLEAQFGTFQVAISIGPVPGVDAIELLVGPAGKRKG